MKIVRHDMNGHNGHGYKTSRSGNSYLFTYTKGKVSLGNTISEILPSFKQTVITLGGGMLGT